MQPRDGRDADDGTVRLLKIRQREFTAIDRTPEVDVHQAVKHAEVHIVEDRTHRKPGIADQHVDSAELVHGGLDQPAALVDVRHIDAAVGGLPAL